MASSLRNYRSTATASSSRERPGERSTSMAFGVVAPFLLSHTTSSKTPYDVFINHRGPDVKSTLARTLYRNLQDSSVTAFLDEESLELGDSIPIELVEVMRSVSVHIAIFSNNYAQSAWCLEELSFMLETDAKIIPVFYHVKPCDLRHVAKGKGIYAEVFSQHERNARFEPETLDKWKAALHKVSFIKGCELKADYDEKNLVESIVKRVCKEIDMKKERLDVAKYPVGIDATVKRFEKWLESSVSQETVQFVGIVGQGGSGKTTLAKALYNQKRSLKERSSFLFGVRDDNLCELQKRLLSDIVPRRNFRFHHVSEGKPILGSCLPSVSTLIVLDDVDDAEQLDALLCGRQSISDDSLIIVTTQDSDVFKQWGCFSIFKMEPLNSEHAKQLFCYYAFSQPEAHPEFKDLVTRIVDACDGLPLSLKVFGKMVSGHQKDYWESKLGSVMETLPEGIVQALKVSYDSLRSEQERQMFLDTACFFTGEKTSLVIEVWDEAEWGGLAGLQTLVNKCLVELDQHGRIRMQRHLRDLGKKIASEKSPYRIWVAEQINNIRRHSEVPTQIRGIMAAKTQFARIYSHQEFPTCSEHYPPPFEECMELLENSNRGYKLLKASLQLKLLVVAHEQMTSSFAELAMDLVWLRWFDFKGTCLPQWMSLKNLRVLEFCGDLNLEELWKDDACNPPSKLRELTVAANSGNNFNRFPSSISHLKDLKKMVLISRCEDGFGFTSLPEEFCELKKLEHLELRYCGALSSLPTRFGDLKELRHLDLCACHYLRQLPRSFKQLIKLMYLNLSHCRELMITSDLLENMRSLEKLFFSGCRNLKKLPSHITEQKFLRELRLVDTELKEVPIELYELSNLQTLKIGSSLLATIPPSLYCFPGLTNLSIRNCDNLSSLSNCINSYTRSQKGLAQLQHFSIKSSNIGPVLQLLSFSQLTNLQTLKISACPVEELCLRPGSLANLKVMNLTETRVKSISISKDCCPRLEILRLRKNAELEVIKVFPPSVNMIELVDCPRLLIIRHLTARTKLKASGCAKFCQVHD